MYSWNHAGYRTSRVTRKVTFAPPIGTPVYAVALPGTFTSALSLAGSFGVSTVTWNFGRLYSSTATCVAPIGTVSVRIVIRPVSRSRGAVKLPENEP